MDLQDRLRSVLSSLSSQGFDTRPLIFEAPATETDLVSVERQLGIALPLSFRDVLASVSAHIEFRWFAPKDSHFPEPFHQNFSGDIHWSLPLLVQFDEDRQQWAETVFKDPNDPYDRIWHEKLAFHEVGNGDYLAIDLAATSKGAVVYLSHDAGEGHGHVLATSFVDLIERWVPLGCTGAEDWQWIPFTRGLSSPIDPLCDNARRWRELLKVGD